MIQQQYNTTSAIDSDGDVALRSDSGSTQGSEAVRLTLRKAEKLRHKSLVENLFKEGFSVYEFPLRMQVRALSEDELESSFRNGAPDGIAPLQMLVTVPKKKRRHAVDRVLMRRRIREAYRLGRSARSLMRTPPFVHSPWHSSICAIKTSPTQPSSAKCSYC